MALSTFITYLSGLLIEKAGDSKAKKKLWVFLCFAINLAILFTFKYYNFLMSSISLTLGKIDIIIEMPAFNYLLPVGISFYTFQALSYTMDVYRGDVKTERNLGKYALFVSFFPQLVAGPIERSKDLLDQFNERHYMEYNRIKRGLLLMLWGFFQKLVIADRVAILVNTVYNHPNENKGITIMIATVLFAVQIYCDFSSYSDIARGAAEVMGFRLMQNFKRPYFSKSIAEFWRRWHISLSTWFKDYLYIPLGGNRKGKLKQYRNIMIVFITSGLWHGANWTFVIWGALHGIYQIIGSITKPARDKIIRFLHINRNNKIHKLFMVLFTFALVNFGWIFFRANSLADAKKLIANMFIIDFSTLNISTLIKLGLDKYDIIVAMIAILILFIVSLIRRNNSFRDKLNKQNIIVRWSIYLVAIFAILIFGIYGPGYDASQFIYFQF
jgi:D-alanyl-lipoteichoic acid acyltransferase DltB (MBOAT superfamily)